MLRLVESIKLENGILHNLQYHQERMDRSVLSLTGRRNSLRLTDRLLIPEEYSQGLYKCRIVYTDRIELVELIPYSRREIRSLKAVRADIDYSCKFEDRSHIDLLFAQRGTCDDILIIKNGFITDTSFSNTAFSDGERWYTPANPLLKGTKRSLLIKTGELSERRIALCDLDNYTSISIINAMIDLMEIVIPVEAIQLL